MGLDRPAVSDWCVYVLISGAGITYTGIAINVTARLALHNSGRGAKFTRGRGPWHLIHQEGPFTHGDALRRETAIKRDRAFKAALKDRWGGETRPPPSPATENRP